MTAKTGRKRKSATPRKLRIAIVGAGWQANYAHYSALSSMSDIEIAAMCDIDPVALKTTGDRYGIGKRYGADRDPKAYRKMIEEMAPEAYVRAGFHVSHAGVILVADLARDIPTEAIGPGYEIVEAEAKAEFGARTFRWAAMFEGKEVATCGGRFYPLLGAPAGAPVGQLGFVGTDEAHRGRHLGRVMVQMSLRRLKEWGASEALIATGLDNAAALRAYESAGFERRCNINEWSKELIGGG